MIGKTVSHYRIVEKLGAGGMGIVYLAEDVKLERQVALKFLPSELTLDEEMKTRFIHEAQAASAIDHPNICNIHEIDETPEGQLFICMAYYGRETLKARISQGMLPFDTAVDYAAQIAEGLGKAHEQGIVHRDIKPANLLVTDDGFVKIVDFGLAILAGKARLTKSLQTIGTVAYMSPEQLQGGTVDHRADIWSLGVVLYEMLTGRLPFRGEFEQALLYSILNEEPEPLPDDAAPAATELSAIIGKALSKNPDERYQRIQDFEADLAALRSPATGALRKVSRHRTAPLRAGRKSIKRRIVTPAIVVLLAALFVILRPLLFNEVLVSEPKPVAVISFENQTGDASYDYLQKAIPNLLSTSLEQSKYIRVVTWERMADLLEQMGRTDVDVIDKNTGFELCDRENIDTIVLGSFTKAGTMFATDVKVLDTKTKTVIKSASSKGSGVESILDEQIDALSKEIARGIGLSMVKVEESHARIADVTTTSMEAYNYFLRGKEDYEKYYLDDALHFLEKAIQIDSTFAVAHLYHALTLDKLGDAKRRNKAYEKAMAFREHASQKERLYIEAEYAKAIDGDSMRRFEIYRQIAKRYPKEKRAHVMLGFSYYWGKGKTDKAIKELMTALELDPNDGYAMNQLAYMYLDMNEYEKAIAYFEKYATVSPGDANPLDSMGETYLRMGRLDDAISKFKEALAVRPDFGVPNWKIAYVYALRERYDDAMRWIDRYRESTDAPSMKIEVLLWKGFYFYWQGRMHEAIAELDSAETLAETMGSDWWKMYVYKTKAWVYYDGADYESGVAYRKEWFDYFASFRAEFKTYFEARYAAYLGLIDLKRGRIQDARSRLAEIESLVPHIPPGQLEWIQFRYGLLKREVTIADGPPDEAVRVCTQTKPMKMPVLATTSIISYMLPGLTDATARAYVRAGKPDKAIAEYERLITFDPADQERYLVFPKCHYRLGVLYEENGEFQKAREELRIFLDIWSHADGTLPELLDARKRIAALQAKIES